jgi:hypothetical protein
MKNIGWYLVIGVFLIGIITLLTSKFTPQTKLVKVNAPVTTASPANKTISLSMAMESNKDVVCTFEKLNSSAKQRGVVYISSGKMRLDNMLDGQAKNQVLSLDGWYYIWTENKKGVKINATQFPNVTATNSGTRLLGSYANMDPNTQINCLPWNADQNVFTIPKDIDLVDITAQIKRGI